MAYRRLTPRSLLGFGVARPQDDLDALIRKQAPMSSRNRSFFLFVSLLVVVSLTLIPSPAFALRSQPDTNSNAALADFVRKMTNGTEALTGVFVENSFAYPVVQQPSGNTVYVSSANDTATEYSSAAKYGNVGLLAHNTLGGRRFSELVAGQRIFLVFGSGRVEGFVVSQIYRYEAIDPNNSKTNLRDPANGMVYNSDYVFRKMYAGSRHVTLQTCIEKNGNASWGRMFIIATPLPAGTY